MYTLQISEEFAEAIKLHGGRYQTTNLLCRLIDGEWTDTEDLYPLTIDVEEYEAWELLEAWKNESLIFACGSPELNQWFQEFIDSIV